MKKIITSMFFIFVAFCSFAQFELKEINCIILIDGKLPSNNGRLSGFIEYNNEFNLKDTVVFYYYVGRIGVKTTDIVKLLSLPDTTTITIHIHFVEYIKKCTRRKYHYCSPFPLKGLFSDTYVVFSITNFNKKKCTYYFDYDAYPYTKHQQKGYKKKYKIFQDSRFCKPIKKL